MKGLGSGGDHNDEVMHERHGEREWWDDDGHEWHGEMVSNQRFDCFLQFFLAVFLPAFGFLKEGTGVHCANGRGGPTNSPFVLVEKAY